MNEQIIKWLKHELIWVQQDLKWAWNYGASNLDQIRFLRDWLMFKLEDLEKENDPTK